MRRQHPLAGGGAPESKLTIINNITEAIPLVIKGGNNTLSPLPQYTGLSFGYGGAIGYQKAAILFEFIDAAGRGNLHFATDNAADSTNVNLSDVRMTIASAGNVGIGTITPGFKLEVNGSFAATTKSFLIDHPTQPGRRLCYGSLEGPENGVYVRGRITGSNTIDLPEYWTRLVDPESITVQLTAVGHHQNLYVKQIALNQVQIGNSNWFRRGIDCSYVVHGERADVEPLQVERD
jgi:hypothetical protein